MSSGEIHKNDVGTPFTITVGDANGVLDISTSSDKRIIFRKPDGSSTTVSGTFSTDGTDGKIVYTFQDGDLDVDGRWRVQAHLTFPSGSWYTDVNIFRVHDNL